MFNRSLLVTLLGVLIILRASWALLFHVNVTLYRFGIANPAGIDGYLSELVYSLPILLIFPLFAFTFGYLAAGILVLRRIWWAALVYFGAFLIDAGVWIYMSTQDLHERVFNGHASALDVAFNLFDLTVLTILFVWAIHKRRLS